MIHSKVASRLALLFPFFLILQACSAVPPPPVQRAPTQRAPTKVVRPAPRPVTRPVTRPVFTSPLPARPLGGPGSYQNAPPPGMVAAIQTIWAGFPSPAGVAIARADGTWVLSHRGDERFPQQSVSKTWVTMALLDAVDKGRARLDERVTVRDQDLTVFNQPIAELVDEDGYETTYDELVRWAMRISDNTANDMILKRVGGPSAIRAMIAEKGMGDIRFSEGETAMQSATAGLTWRPEYRKGRAFQTARAQLPMDVREKAIWRYIADPPDGASPSAIARSLIRLYRGELLSPESTRLMLTRMSESTTGPKRLKAGLPSDWRFLHKTGTGQDLFGLNAGYNDIALATAPDGTTYAIVVLIRNTRASVPARMAFMQSISSAVAANHVR
jgi:beta-lactamase class A